MDFTQLMSSSWASLDLRFGEDYFKGLWDKKGLRISWILWGLFKINLQTKTQIIEIIDEKFDIT